LRGAGDQAEVEKSLKKEGLPNLAEVRNLERRTH
jgi:hypothetical protein